MRYLIGRYHEIALKGRNQWRFIDQLTRNVRDAFADYRLGEIRSRGPRLMVELPEEISDEVAAERASAIFGLQNFSISRAAALDLETLKREVVAAVSGIRASSFCVRTRREYKRFHMNSI